MPQFDLTTLWSQLFGLIPIFFLFYFFNINNTIPFVVKVKKIRSKIIMKSYVVNKSLNFSLNDLNNLKLLNYKVSFCR